MHQKKRKKCPAAREARAKASANKKEKKETGKTNQKWKENEKSKMCSSQI